MHRSMRNNGGERGVVLLLTLVSLVLISAIVASILYTSSAELALVAYQRQSAAAFDAALGGMEEARSRLSTGDNMFMGNWMSGLVEFPNPEINAGNAGLGIGQVLYVINPAGGEVVAPWVTTNEYYDWQYFREFGTNIEAVPQCLPDPIVSPPTNPPSPPLQGPCGFSVLSDQIDPDPDNVLAAAGIPQASYKWVRVTLATEATMNRDVNRDGTYDPQIPVYWDRRELSMNIDVAKATRDLNNNGVVSSDERRGRPVYRITSMSKTPTGGVRMLQYEVSGTKLVMNFPGAVSLIGQGASCGTTQGNDPQNQWGPSNASDATGDDQAPGGTGIVPAIAMTDPAAMDDCNTELAGPPDRTANWTGSSTTGTVDSNQYPNLSTTADMQNIIRDVTSMADQIFWAGDPPPISNNNNADNFVDISGADLGECSDNFQTRDTKITVVNGSTNLGGIEGCGVLLITGNATVSGSLPKWKGMILIIGNGDFDIGGGGQGSIEGALLLSKIYCGDDNNPPNCNGSKPRPVLTEPGAAEFTFSGGGNMDISYNSFWIGGAFNNVKQQILSFRELGRTD